MAKRTPAWSDLPVIQAWTAPRSGSCNSNYRDGDVG